MNDRELLELAAKAAGMKVFCADDGTAWNLSTGGPDKPDIPWNPLTSDADAFRLMVDCGIDVLWSLDFTRAHTVTHGYCIEPHGTDKHAATRRAIVRAAAAVGVGE